ncbi:hypothetical protein Tco_0676423 [Tanacetum coccineum]|uniref:Uncharacterized protein n=1 Tax=Tanacetum coccineum TaxID=301880 RepID=A0ABQ5JEU7_9ASTR
MITFPTRLTSALSTKIPSKWITALSGQQWQCIGDFGEGIFTGVLGEHDWLSRKSINNVGIVRRMIRKCLEVLKDFPPNVFCIRAHLCNENHEFGSPHLETKKSAILKGSLTRRSDFLRQTKLPSSLNDIIIHGKVKYGIEKVVNYVNLDLDSLCFASSLNRSVEPSCYEHVILDNNWIDAMNYKIEDLNKNHTWIITDLPVENRFAHLGYNNIE